MKFSNRQLGENVEIDPTTTFNNVAISHDVRIAKRCCIFGLPENLLERGSYSYVGMNTLNNGFAAKVKIGSYVSIAQHVIIMAGYGPCFAGNVAHFPL